MHRYGWFKRFELVEGICTSLMILPFISPHIFHVIEYPSHIGVVIRRRHVVVPSTLIQDRAMGFMPPKKGLQNVIQHVERLNPWEACHVCVDCWNELPNRVTSTTKLQQYSSSSFCTLYSWCVCVIIVWFPNQASKFWPQAQPVCYLPWMTELSHFYKPWNRVGAVAR